jgi:hypothetical protein
MFLQKRKPEQYIPWNKGKLVGQKPPLKLREIWAIRIRLQQARRTRDLALFNLAIDSKLRACDLVRIRFSDVDPVLDCNTGLASNFKMYRATDLALQDDPPVCARRNKFTYL